MLVGGGGRLILLSTPWGKRGFFWREWHEGKNWLKLQITAEECPRLSKAWVEDRRAFMSEWEFKQEYMCEFGANVSAYFDPDAIDAAMVSDAKALTLDADGKLDFASFFGVSSPDELPENFRKKPRRF